MEKVKALINHPLAKAILTGFIGTMLLVEAHPLYAGVAFGYALREIFLAFKAE